MTYVQTRRINKKCYMLKVQKAFNLNLTRIKVPTKKIVIHGFHDNMYITLAWVIDSNVH